MSLRQKLVLASKSPAAETSSDEHLAQKLFLEAVETGLSSESILSEIKSLLRDLATSDEDLIFAVGQASSADPQRLNKISKVKGSKGRVNMLNLSRSVPEECDEKLMGEPSSDKAGGDEAFTELLKSMQKQLNSLQGQVKDMKLDKTSRQSFPNDTSKFRSNKCQDCLANNCACVHCFICGHEGHIARKCPQKGNGQGLRN